MVKKFYSGRFTFLKFFLRFLVVFFILFSFIFYNKNPVFASDVQGTIDTTYKYAWGENIGWLNFGCDRCGVSVTDTGLSGYAWSRQYGWINLNPSNSGVKNNTEGTLSGYAWSSNLGWINFTGVEIDSSGNFSGYATIKSDSSRISFNCGNANSCSSADFKVNTDWRPYSKRYPGSGSGHSAPLSPPVSGTPPATPPIVPAEIPPVSPPISNPVVSVIDDILNLFKLKRKSVSVIAEIPKIPPLSFKTQWNLLPVKAIREFVFAPLPYEVRILASKFPELDKTLKTVGINRFSDMNKLTGVTLNIPGLTTSGKMINSVGAGPIALVKGLPVAKFSLAAKKNLPAEFIFARANGELVDLNVAMSIDDKGKISQKISSLPGKTLRLVVKPISQARSVIGYFVFKSATPKIVKNEISRASLTASALFSLNSLVEKNPEPVPIENKLVLSSFEYTDPDRDGIYTADVVSPLTPGEYEIITVIDYIDPVLGVRQMRMITVIDPEGYVFEKNQNNNTAKETRIPGAIVSLYYLNTVTKKYEIWRAKDYQQENPQITDIRGTYSFLVPEGSYYFQVEAPGYDPYEGKVFAVAEGNSIHQNIELKSGLGFISDIDWQTILLIVVFLLLVYNLYRNSLRDKLLNFSNKNNGK